MHDEVFNLNRQLLDEKELSKNKDITNQVLHDELQALQLELVKREERMRDVCGFVLSVAAKKKKLFFSFSSWRQKTRDFSSVGCAR